MSLFLAKLVEPLANVEDGQENQGEEERDADGLTAEMLEARFERRSPVNEWEVGHVTRYATAKRQYVYKKPSGGHARKMSLAVSRLRPRQVQLKKGPPVIKMMTCTNQNFWPGS